jgi:hypothetical protein
VRATAGGTKAIPKKVVQKKVPAKKKVGTQAVATDIAILRNFKQNADGSLTGKVFNSKSFRNGTEITTSPVKKGAKKGTVVQTSSGSKYQLQ